MRCTELLSLLLIFLWCACTTLLFCNSTNGSADQPKDKLHEDDVMSYNQTLVSKKGNFTLGFFTLGGNINNRTYLGIWCNSHNVSSSTPILYVWVANRDRPILSSIDAKLTVGDGYAMLLDSRNLSYWSTNVTSLRPRSKSSYSKMVRGHHTCHTRLTRPAGNFTRLTTMNLQDNGNLVLTDENQRSYSWQSFDHPTDTFLSGMKSTNWFLTSWKDAYNPGSGHYNFSQVSGYSSTFAIKSGSSLYWQSDPKISPRDLSDLLLAEASLPLLVRMSFNGTIQLWKQVNSVWSIEWSAPLDACSIYDACGNYGSCNAENAFYCKCLPGYVPTAPNKWDQQSFQGGCTRKSKLSCDDPRNDTFIKLPMMNIAPRLPPSNETLVGEEKCRHKCLRDDCDICWAYSYDNSQCLIWPIDALVQEDYSAADGYTINLRINSSDIERTSRDCKTCGTFVLPYPLSITNSKSCGDPNYKNFSCNSSTGQLSFETPGGTYRVTYIDSLNRWFLIQADINHDCGAQCVTRKLNSYKSMPFNVENCISTSVPIVKKPVIQFKISWKPPPEPTCDSPTDCRDWPDTTCQPSAEDGKMRCICGRNLHWNSTGLECIKVHHWKPPSALVSGIAAAGAIALLCSVVIIADRWIRQTTKKREGLEDLSVEGMEEFDIPFVDWEVIVDATENFSDANKLGVGGFGPVYKGKLPEGREVAVKRLSSASKQGAEEFRNEVVLIAKLQHRNLVRVLGYCIKGGEQILLYEYMPNKSLDAFLFDGTLSTILDWKKRFEIMVGIARGLVYLHQDSRLRIIHRDLKPSNILLDDELNPKISDFGLARIVGGKEAATSTTRVVGTHGYMSPEYALEGSFSVKSDVYSFGVVVLEIISGRKITSVIVSEETLSSLLGHAWSLWSEGKPAELLDRTIRRESIDYDEVSKCVNLGLLCVQEDPSDRPTMSTVCLMLAGETAKLPSPRRPAFTARKLPPRPPSSSDAPSSSTFSSRFKTSSNLEITMTSDNGR